MSTPCEPSFDFSFRKVTFDDRRRPTMTRAPAWRKLITKEKKKSQQKEVLIPYINSH